MLTVYSKANCPFCDKAKFLLETKGVQFEEVRIDLDSIAREFLIAQGHRSVPQIYKDGTVFVKRFEDLNALDDTDFQQLRG
jgi:glutaredoxin 3